MEHPSHLIKSFAAGKFNGSNDRLITALDNNGSGEIYLSSGTTSISVLHSNLYANPFWDILALTRAAVNPSTGEEIISCLDKDDNAQVWSGDGTTLSGGATNLVQYYQGL